MFERFFPQIYIKSIYDLPINYLNQKGARLLFFDIDNTIVPHFEPEADERIIDFFNNLQGFGFKVCLFSNNNSKRVERFNEKIKVHAISRAGKPGIRKLLTTMEFFGETRQTTVLIGDQVFTDMWCGYRAGVLTILTSPISTGDQFITKIKRGAERRVLKMYFKKRGNDDYDYFD